MWLSFLKPRKSICNACVFVFEHFQEHNLKLKSSKYEFFYNEISYLAHHVSKDSIWPSKENLKAVAEFAPPQTYTKIWVFLSLVGHYQWFIKGFANVAQLLHEHLFGEVAGKKSKWVMLTSNAQAALRCLRKHALRPLCWLLLTLINHFSWKLMLAS